MANTERLDVSMRRPLGRTGLSVSPLGLGGGPLGDTSLDDSKIDHLIGSALDAGINLIDSAPSYGVSEERIGRALRGRRSDMIVATKGIYGTPGVEEWTSQAVMPVIETALRKLATDHLDIFLLHSCPIEKIERVLDALIQAKNSGKVRAIGYSGDGEALDWAASCDALDVIECSVNLFDQAALSGAIPRAIQSGKGVIAKRAMANAPWLSSARPQRQDSGTYWDRMHAMMNDVTEPMDDLAVRFAAFADGVSTALVGTKESSHLAHAVSSVAKGALPKERYAALREQFMRHGSHWPGVI